MDEETKDQTTEEVAPKHIDTKTETRNLRVALTNEELLKQGSEMAEAKRLVDELTDDMKSMQKSYKAKIDAAEQRVEKAGTLICQEYEIREVDCEVTYDYDNGTISATRSDTSEQVESRNMDAAEMQRKLKLWPEGKTPSEDQNYEPEVGHVELHDAIKIIQERKRAAVTVLQRGMGISDRRAWMIIEKLEEIGVVGPPVGEGEPREILKDEVTLQRFLEDYDERAEEHDKEQVLNSLMADKKEAVEAADVEE